METVTEGGMTEVGCGNLWVLRDNVYRETVRICRDVEGCLGFRVFGWRG